MDTWALSLALPDATTDETPLAFDHVMAKSEALATLRKPKRRWFQFSLRTLLLFTAALGILLGWIAATVNRIQHKARIVSEIQAAGGRVFYDYQMRDNRITDNAQPPGWKLLRRVFGENAFANVTFAYLSGPNTPDRTVASLKELPKLRDVGLSGPAITDAQLAHMVEIRDLRGLALDYTSVTPDGPSVSQKASLECQSKGVTIREKSFIRRSDS